MKFNFIGYVDFILVFVVWQQWHKKSYQGKYKYYSVHENSLVIKSFDCVFKQVILLFKKYLHRDTRQKIFLKDPTSQFDLICTRKHDALEQKKFKWLLIKALTTSYSFLYHSKACLIRHFFVAHNYFFKRNIFINIIYL